MCPKSLWRQSRQVSESHLRHKGLRGWLKWPMAVRKRLQLALIKLGKCKKASVDLCQIIPGRLPGRAMWPQQKEVESKCSDLLTIDHLERSWVQPYQENHNWETSISWYVERHKEPRKRPVTESILSSTKLRKHKYEGAILPARKNCLDSLTSSPSSTSRMALS